MTSAPTIRCRWTGGALLPVGNYAMAAACDAMSEGETVGVTIEHGRSDTSHNHQFAWIGEAWKNLPEGMEGSDFAQSPDTLRKYALVMTGFRNVEMFIAADKQQAGALASTLSRDGWKVHGYCVVETDGRAVRRTTPLSQSKQAMGNADFQRSKQAILDYIAGMLGVPPEELRRAA